VYLPLSLLQQRYWVYSAIHYGHDVVVVPYELAFHALKRKEPTVIMGVPSFYDTLRQQIEATAAEREGAGATAGGLSARCAKVLGGRIRYMWTGSAPARVSTLRFFEEQCGIPIYEGYGMNETCIVSKNAPGAHRTGSVGRVVDGKTVTFDERGVLIVASAYPVATHYMFGGAQAENVFTPDGAVVTGDTGHLDQDGFLYITGRLDDVVALGNGRNVAVRSIEDAIKSWPVIAECVVCGAGESRLVAVVSLAQPVDLKALRAHIERVNATLGVYERVADVVVASEPFSIENGLLGSQSKPKRKAIIAAYRDEITRLYGEAPCTTSNPS
jgi:long-chain acyl-CoA synthetase